MQYFHIWHKFRKNAAICVEIKLCFCFMVCTWICQHLRCLLQPLIVSYDFVVGAIYEILHLKTAPVEPGRLQWKMLKLLWSQVELDNDPGDRKRFWSLTTTPETNKCPWVWQLMNLVYDKDQLAKVKNFHNLLQNRMYFQEEKNIFSLN